MDPNPLDPRPKSQIKEGRKFIAILIGIVLIVLLVIFLIVAFIFERPQEAGANKVSDQSEKLVTTQVKGFSFSPKSSDISGITDFYNKAKDHAVTWAGDWQELSDSSKFPFSFIENSRKYNFTPVIIVGLYNQGEKKLNRPLTQTTLEAYKTNAIKFAKKYQPPFFGMGVEVDIMYENHPSEFEKFVTLFNETASAIKTESPNTQIFTAFQLERTKGLRGGLFGGVNDSSKHNWTLLEKFPQADFIAFTTYPHLIYKNPNEIPSNYYKEIMEKTSKNVAFIETGWPSVNIATGWESSEEEQNLFVDTFISQIKPLDPKLVVWPFMYDNDAFGPAFKGLGLITKEGKTKPSWEKWESATFN